MRSESTRVNATHPDYDSNLPAWVRARDVIAGEDAIKSGGEKYVSKLESQTRDEFDAYVSRASFFNATARTADGYVGLVFRRPPFVKLPEPSSALGKALSVFNNDADMLGNPFASYAKNVVSEVISIGRAGTLIDWEENENRAYLSLYSAENILNWCVTRINGRNLLSRLVLHEYATESKHPDSSPENKSGECSEPVEQIRVLKLVESSGLSVDTSPRPSPQSGEGVKCVVELWQRVEAKNKRSKTEWQCVETRTPLRLGRPLPLIPFVFHGPRNSQPAVDKLPLADVIAINLDHYRLDADYKHGMHFTALPTAWVSGFDKNATLRIGSSTAWTTETPGATAGFLEYTGQGLTTFERAMDRDERLMAVLGARLLEDQKRVGETAEAIELRQTGEHSILGNITSSLSASLTQILRWVYWWNSTEALPDDVTSEQVTAELNTDFSTKGMTAQELVAVVNAWQNGAISRDTMYHLFRRNEILPEGRTCAEEESLVSKTKPTGEIQKDSPQP